MEKILEFLMSCKVFCEYVDGRYTENISLKQVLYLLFVRADFGNNNKSDDDRFLAECKKTGWIYIDAQISLKFSVN